MASIFRWQKKHESTYSNNNLHIKEEGRKQEIEKGEKGEECYQESM